MIYFWANLIARLCSRSALGQISLQDFARDPPLGKHYCRTWLAIHFWANTIAGLCPQSTFGHPDLSLTNPQSAHVPLHSEFLLFTLSIPPPPQPSSCYLVESITFGLSYLQSQTSVYRIEASVIQSSNPLPL